MKKAISVILLLILLLCAAGCDAKHDGRVSPDELETEQPTVPHPEDTFDASAEEYPVLTYPLNADRTYSNLAVELPEHIYNTTGAENGLGGTVYKITGTVTDYFTLDLDDFIYEHVIVSTEGGDVLIVNTYKAVYNATMLNFGAEFTKSFYPYDVDDYVFPNVGEKANFIVVYMSYSGTENLATFVLGANPSIFEILEVEDPAKTQSNNPAHNKTDDQSSVQTSNATAGEQNALRSAKNYLSFSAFSYNGLVDQLKFEGYTTEEATYAADNCGADWNGQALASAHNYLSFSAFSYNGLIDQLEYEQFTAVQATYAADNCGADWNEQAAKSAAGYLDLMSFSREGLIDQLKFEGFTHDQAVYGVEANGY